MIRRGGVLLSVWCCWFAAVHVAWAAGWRWGVPDRLPPISERPAFLAYDLTAAGALILLALFGLAVARHPDTARSARSQTILRVGVVLTGLRALIGVIGDVAMVLAEETPTAVTLVADLWFTLAAALMAALLLASHRTDTTAGSGSTRGA